MGELMRKWLQTQVKDTYNNLKEGSIYKYKEMKDIDFFEVADSILNNEKDMEQFWDLIDSFILEELNNNYEDNSNKKESEVN